VVRNHDISQFVPDSDQGRGLGRNVLGFAYGTFTLVLPAGQLTGGSASPSLTTSVENRLRPPSIVELDAMIMSGAAIARRAIDWIDSQDFAGTYAERPAIEAWTGRVLALARIVLKDDDVQLVKEVSSLILTELGWEDSLFEEVCKSGLRAVYDDDPPLLTPLSPDTVNGHGWALGVRPGGHGGGACGVMVAGVRVGTTEWERPARLKFAA
jgi:hypothetical protein